MGNAADLPQTAETELDQLLSEDVTSAKSRQLSAFDRMAEPFGESLVLFGAGHVGRKTLKGLRRIGIKPLALTDNDPAKWGRPTDGVPILSPQDAARQFSDQAAFVVTIWRPRRSYLRTKRQLVDLGCSKVVTFAALFWKYPDVFLPHYQIGAPQKVLERSVDVREAYALMSDEESCRQYVAQIRWRLLLDFDGLPVPSLQDQYFPSGVVSLSSDEVFVDCGAYIGDTIRRFLARQGPAFSRIIAFEPDLHSFEELLAYLSTLDSDIRSKIRALNCAVGARCGRVRFHAHGSAGSRISSKGSTEIDCVALDEQLSGDTPTYLKLDVEGTEYDTLVGAREVITRARPIVAVSVYHRPTDLWELPLYLHSLYADYRFFLRTHDNDGTEVVCYAVPPHRLLDHPHRKESLANV